MVIKSITLVCILSFFLLSTDIIPQINAEKFRIATDSLGFSARVDLDLTLLAGNTDFVFLGTNARLNYNRGNDYTFLVLNGGYGINDGESFFSQAIFHLRNVDALNDFASVEEFVQYNNNKEILLLDRALIGGGLRLKLINNDELVMRIGPSIFFEHEVYDLDSLSKHKRITNSVRLNLYFTSLIKFQENLSFLSIIYLQPKIDQFEDFRILFDSALNIKLGKSFDLMIKLEMRYDNLPADDVEKFDLITKLGIAMYLE
jgi:hypothetical protein